MGYLFVEGGVDLVDHLLESFRLLKNVSFIQVAFYVIEQLGFIFSGEIFDLTIEIQIPNLLSIKLLYRIPQSE